VISGRACTTFAALITLPGSCIADPAARPLAAAAAQTRKAAPPPPPRPVAVGLFMLDAPPVQGGLVRGRVPPGTTRLVIDGRDVGFAPDRAFVAGFGRDYATVTRITAFRTDGSAVTDERPVARRAWRIEHLRTLPRFAQPTAEFQARRPGELARINAARRKASDSQGWRQRFVWPAAGRISGVFGSQRIYAGEPGAPHNGVDVAAPVGAPVRAPADGVVILAANAPFTLEGKLLMLDHGMGLNSAFLHLSRIDVAEGAVVRQGQTIGAVGATGRATGPHLHWGLRWADERLDPQALTGAMASVR
jgi:murein DD-endopeptidase MepM/ murein hydrolase activator NlpD